MPHSGDPDERRNGLEVLEEFYGDRLGADLIERAARTPHNQLAVLAEALSEWYERVSKSPAGPADATDGILEPRIALFDQVPLAARPSLDSLLLIAPRIIVSDPVLAWSRTLLRARRMRWPPSGLPFGDDALVGDSGETLASILAGLTPLNGLIRSGDIVLHAGPSAPRSSALANWRLDNSRYGARGMMMNGFPLGEEGALASVEYNRDVLELAEHFLAALSSTRGVPIPTGLNYLFRGSESAEAIILSMPRMELGIRDAIQMRRSEEAFIGFRSALREVVLAAGFAADSEPPEVYAARVRDAATRHFGQADEQLKSAVSRGKVFGMVPTAAGTIVRLGAGAVDMALPGGSIAASGTAKWLVREQVASGAAAQTALRYSLNLRLTGRL